MQINDLEYYADPYCEEGSNLVAIGWQTSWLLIFIFHLTCVVAVGDRVTIMPEFNYVIGGYLAAIFGGVIYLYYKFRRPSDVVN